MKSRSKRPATWAEKAEALGALIPPSQWHAAVESWTAQRRKSDEWCVAFSGGADSLALLLLIWARWPERREKLVALHFNHRLRGRESNADEAFCKKVCAALGVTLRVGKWLEVHKGASEAEARRARQGFFGREMRRERSKVLWLAHQQDDIAESMVMRLARGSGTGGLAAPRPVQAISAEKRVHVRPLLTLKKAELVKALRKVGADWREDSSNGTDDYFRNRVRGRVLPAWVKASGRDALGGAALSRERLEEDDAALEAWVDSLPILARGELDVQALAKFPRAVKRRALHRWLLGLKARVDLSRQAFEVLLNAVEKGDPTRFSLGKKGFAVLRRGFLGFSRR